MLLGACEPGIPSGTDPGTTTGTPTDTTPSPAQGTYIANHLVAHESVIRSIPKQFINTARTALHIAYQHTSHGTHVAFGMFGLPDSKIEGTDWYKSKNTPGGSETYGSHNTQYITANRKAYAMWWVLARIAGWDDN